MAIPFVIRKLLYIDDDVDDCFFFEEQLKEIDPSIKLICVNESLHLFLHAKELKPDLIFVDIAMPSANGFECIRALKKDPELASIPVIIYSSSYNPKDIEEGFRSGADLFVTKPAALHKIKNTIMAILELNWHDPEQIRASHFINGSYERFRVS